MKRNLLLIAGVLMGGIFHMNAQNVGIGTATPHPSAKLQIEDANRGILIPRISLSNVILSAPVTAPATGLLVYNNNAAVVGGSGTGFYYWDGSQWVKLGTGEHNTLDKAYDEGGPGIGRVINADAGTVEINGTGGLWVNATDPAQNTAIQVDNTDGVVKSNVEIGFIDNSGINYNLQGIRAFNDYDATALGLFDGSFGVYGVTRHSTGGTINLTTAANSNNKAIGVGGSLGSTTTFDASQGDMIAAIAGITGHHNSGGAPVNGGRLYAGLFSGNGRTLGLWGENSTFMELIPKRQTGDYDAAVVGFYNASANGGNNNADIGTGDNYFSLEANVSDATVKHMTLQTRTNGNVGIGTAVPTEKLHVVGGTRISSLSGTSNRLVQANANGVLSTLNTLGNNGDVLTSNGLGGYSWQSAINSSWNLLGNGGTNPNINFLGTTDAQDLVFRTNNTENMRVNTNGNVGIGTALDIAKLFLYTDQNDFSTLYGFNNNYYSAVAASNTYAARNYNNSTTTGIKYGFYNSVNNLGTGGRYGIYSITNMNTSSSSFGYGIYSYLVASGAGIHSASYNSLYLDGTTASLQNFASYNNLSVGISTNPSDIYGEYTDVDFCAGTSYGEYKEMNSNASYTTEMFGDYNHMLGTGNGASYAVYNDFDNTGAGIKYGLRNEFADIPGTKYGIYNYIPNGVNTGTFYGLNNMVYNDGISAKYGVRNYFSVNDGVLYGLYNYITQPTTHDDLIYGNYNYINSLGTGAHYGIYSNVPGDANDYSGLFYAGNFVANEIGGDYDFRVEGDANVNMFFVDASTDRIGIGINNPDYTMQTLVNGTISVNDGYLRQVRALYLQDWDDNTGGIDDKYRVLARDGAHMFYNGGVVVGNYANDTWTDVPDGRLIVEERVGIGAINPTYRLDIDDASTASPTYIYRGRNSNAVGTRTQIGSLEYFSDESSTIDFAGGSNFAINLGAAATYDLQLAVNSAAKPGTSTWTVASDSRLKNDINPFKDGLETLRGIKPVYFKYNGMANIKEDHYFVGVLAQELEQVAPYMVGSFESAPGDIPFEEQEAATETFKSVDNGAMTYIAINAIKELDAKQAKISETFTNISDFGIAKLSAAETYIPFGNSFSAKLEGTPVVTVSSLNSNVSLTIINQNNQGFTVRINGEYIATDINWIAMAKVRESALSVENNYTAEEREVMLQKVVAEKAKINYQAEYDELELRKQEKAKEAAEIEQRQEAGKIKSAEIEKQVQDQIKTDQEAAANYPANLPPVESQKEVKAHPVKKVLPDVEHIPESQASTEKSGK